MDEVQWFEHQCEVRRCLRLSERQLLHDLAVTVKQHGDAAALALRTEVERQREGGNTGAFGMWIDDEIA